MSTERVLRKGDGLYKAKRKLSVPRTLPPLAVQDDSKRSLSYEAKKSVAFTSLYRKAVIDKAKNTLLDMNQKEMEFLGLIPSKCHNKNSMYRFIRREGDNTKKAVSFCLPSDQGSDTGRQKHPVLPPLRRNSKKLSQELTSNSVDEVTASPRRISQAVDKKVVSHLRRRLSKRLERRASQLLDLENNRHSSGEDDLKDNVKSEEFTDIFSSYSDVGEKLRGRRRSSEQRKHLPAKKNSIGPVDHITGGRTRLTSIKSVQPETTPVNAGFENDLINTTELKNIGIPDEVKKKTPLPSISSAYEKETEESQRSLSPTTDSSSNAPSLEKELNESGDALTVSDSTDREGSLFGLTSIKFSEQEKEITEDEKEEHFNFLNMDVSPVPTPKVFRPETSDTSRLNVNDKISRILKGQMNLRLKPNMKTVKVFINSTFTDSTVEQTYLMEKVFAPLKLYYRERGYNLNIVDPHWSMKDLTTDDHSEMDFIEYLLEECKQSTYGINFVTFLGQKYGDPRLPSVISVEEFEAILEAVHTDQQRVLAIMAELAARHEEEERKRQQEREAILEASRLEERENEENSIPSEISQKHEDVSNSGKGNQLPQKQGKSKVDSRKDQDSDNAESENTTESDSKLQELMEGFRRTASQVGKEAMTLKTMKGDYQFRDDVPDPAFLKTWFYLDENSVPPVYRLQNVSTQYKEILRPDASKKIQARNQWLITAKRLQKMLNNYAQKVFNPETANKYCTSLMEIELNQGMLSGDIFSENCYWFHREIEELAHNASDQKARDYMDLVSTHNSSDPELRGKLSLLRDSRVHEVLTRDNIWRYQIHWHPNGVSPRTTRAHQTYLDRLSRIFSSVMMAKLNETIQQETSVPRMHCPLSRDIIQHVHYCHNRSKMFHGRKELLLTIKKYVRSDCNVPLVLYGKSGCGKTALLAKAAKETYKWHNKNCSVLVRMIGLTAASTNIRMLLKSMALQLCYIQGESDIEKLHSDYKGLLNDFNYRISHSNSNNPLIIFIGCLDRLSEDNDGRKLTWLPKELPEHVKIIVSTLPDDRYDCLRHLKRAIHGSHPECFLEVPELPVSDATVILNHWFSNHKRTVTQAQFDVMIEAFQQCPYPLYLKVIFQDALKWPSYLPVADIKLANTVKTVVLYMFGRLEREHGEPLVRRALGYITATRNGITTNELMDILSLDESCMDYVSAHYHPSIRRLPPVCWLRLNYELDSFLEESEADGITILRWCHSQYHEAATERYLNQKDKAPSYHKALAEYFMDMWSEIAKPFGGSGSGKLRYVTPQPLFTEVPLDDSGNTRRVYNLRRLNELPYHFLKSHQIVRLKSECLFNFEFLLAKLSATSLRSLFDDIQMALLAEPTDQDIRFLSDTLHLSTKALQRDCRQLASQIVGRLNDLVSNDIPEAPGDPLKYPFLTPLFKDAKKGSIPALIPSKTCLTAPGGILFDIMSGHTEPITAVVTTSDGQRAVTTAKDNTLKLWELRTGRVTKTITGVGVNVVSLRLGLGNAAAITSETNCIRVHSLNTGNLVTCIDQYADPASITTALDGSLMVAFFDGSNMMRVWNLESNGIPLIKQLHLEMKPGGEYSLHKDNSIVSAPGSHGAKILHAFRGSSSATVRNAKSGTLIYELSVESGNITALAISREYFIVAIRVNYMKLHEIFQLELFDVRNGDYIRTVRGCVNCNVKELFVNQLGSHCLSICSSEANNTADIAIWNIETEDHKHLARHANTSHTGACVDMKYCLTASTQDSTLRIWNLSSKINQPTPKEKVREGLEAIIPMLNYPRYVVAKSTYNGPLSVWNVMKNGCAGNAVRIERGLVESNDIVLVRNTKLVILTNRGFSNVTDDSRAVFQTVRVYDLQQKKYIKKINGCYIVPSPAHEYVVLDDLHFLGLSDNRCHFVIWSLETGHAVSRIKPNFKPPDLTIIDVIDANKKRTSLRQIQPWEVTETKSARERRQKAAAEEEKQKAEILKKEKENAIEQYIISKNLKVIVASYYAHHICVFDVPSQSHTQTLENPNSMLFLHVAALTPSGCHLVHANYDDSTKTSYVTLWDCKTGAVKRRLRNEKNVCAIAVADGAEKVVFGKVNKELRIWGPGKSNSLRKIKGYPGLNFGVGSQIHISDTGDQAIVYAGEVSVWDLEQGTVLAVFTPDMRVNCFTTALGGKLILFGLRDSTEVVTLRLMCAGSKGIDQEGENMFGEKDDTSDEEEEAEGLEK